VNSGKIKLHIDSDFKNVYLVGVTVHAVCDNLRAEAGSQKGSVIGLVDDFSVHMEICVVEAVNNAIIHAYGNAAGNIVEVIIEINPDMICFKVCDTGKTMPQNVMESAKKAEPFGDPEDIKGIPEQGRGLFIINQVMDEVRYDSFQGVNTMSMEKYLDYNSGKHSL